MLDEIRQTLRESAELKLRVAEQMAASVAAAAQMLVQCLLDGGTVAFCGNGGSAADAQHLSGELVGRFRKERPAYRALALTTDTSILTAIGNDYGFDQVFSRQVEGLLREGDVLVAFSTSGNAKDCARAVEQAKALGAKTVGFTGEDGGELGRICDLCLKVPCTVTARIQEVHITLGHILCGLVEDELVARGSAR
jgi:D-sedoheptulose 7-phosphate isomerase